MTVLRDPRIGYKTHGEETVTHGEQGQKIVRTDRFDGSNDVTVHVKAIKLNLTKDAPPNREYVAAIAELEQATKEYRLASRSGSKQWEQYAARRLKAANLRVVEVQ